MPRCAASGCGTDAGFARCFQRDSLLVDEREFLREVTPVKLLLAVVQPTKVSAVRDALQRIGVTRMTLCDAQGYGRQRGRNESYRGHEYQSILLRKVALEIAVNDDFVERTIETIQGVARTGPEGSIGDGKVFVLPLEEALRVTDGVTGPEAI